MHRSQHFPRVLSLFSPGFPCLGAGDFDTGFAMCHLPIFSMPILGAGIERVGRSPAVDVRPNFTFGPGSGRISNFDVVEGRTAPYRDETRLYKGSFD